MANDAAELVDFNKLWDYANPADTERKFRELLPTAEASGDQSYRLQLLTQIARCQGLQGNFNDAHATLDAVERELDATPLPPLPRIRSPLDRGRVFNSSNPPAEAMPLFDQAWRLGESANEMRHAVDAL